MAIFNHIMRTGFYRNLNTISIDNEKPKIVVTTTHIRDLVEKITGNRFRITSLMGPGVDPHIYKPTSRDILAISKADLVVFHGMMLEGKLSEVLSNAGKKGILTFDATAALPGNKLFSQINMTGTNNTPIPMFGLILKFGLPWLANLQK